MPAINIPNSIDMAPPVKIMATNQRSHTAQLLQGSSDALDPLSMPTLRQVLGKGATQVRTLIPHASVEVLMWLCRQFPNKDVNAAPAAPRSRSGLLRNSVSLSTWQTSQ